MRKISTIVVRLLAVAVVAGAVDVYEEELFTVKRGSVEFLNYEGPHAKIETREQIRGIGQSLGSLDTTTTSSADFVGKYSVLHIIDEEDPEGLNADLFTIHATAEVDHIDNIRRILAGYLMQSYDYTFEDARLVAEFITFYNAVFRGNMEYFRNKYKDKVVAALDPATVGLSTRYTEWPGKTQMVIPLTTKAMQGGIGALHTDELTEKEVIEDLREREGKGVEERKEMTELKEREVEQEQARIEEEKGRLDEKAEELDSAIEQKKTEQQAVDESLAEVEQKQGQVEEEKTEIAAREERTPEDEQRQEELEQEEQAIQEEKSRLEEQKQTVEQEKEVLETEREEITQEQEKLTEDEKAQEERQDRIKEEREQIAKDEQGIIEEERAARAEQPEERRTGVFLLTREEDGAVFGQLATVDVQSGDVVGSSGVRTIRGRRVYEFADAILVVAGIKDGVRAVRLTLLDADSFQSLGVDGDTDIYPDTDVHVDADFVYAAVDQDGAYRLGKFGTDLTAVAISETEILPFTAIRMTDEGVLVQASDGTVRVLDVEELGE